MEFYFLKDLTLQDIVCEMLWKGIVRQKNSVELTDRVFKNKYNRLMELTIDCKLNNKNGHVSENSLLPSFLLFTNELKDGLRFFLD